MGKKRLTHLERIEQDNDNRYRKLIKAELEGVERLKRFRNTGADVKSGRIFGFRGREVRSRPDGHAFW